MDQPTHKVFLNLDEDELDAIFNGLQPGDELKIKGGKLALDEIIPGDSGGKRKAVLSIVDLQLSPVVKTTPTETPEVGPGDAVETESAAMTMMAAKKGEG